MLIIKSLGALILLTPTYVNTLIIFSFCNLHDCSWGNRPDKLNDEEKSTMARLEWYRTKWLFIWVITNLGWFYVVNRTDKNSDEGSIYIYLLAGLLLMMMCIRFVGIVLYKIMQHYDNVDFDANTHLGGYMFGKVAVWPY